MDIRDWKSCFLTLEDIKVIVICTNCTYSHTRSKFDFELLFIGSGGKKWYPICHECSNYFEEFYPRKLRPNVNRLQVKLKYT